MAFNINKFSPIGGQSTRGASPQMFSYSTTDSLNTVETEGYFNNARTYLEIKDIITVVYNNATLQYKVTTVPLNGNIIIQNINSITNYRVIDSKDKLPDATSGVITLEDNTGYLITTTIDLLGDRLVCGQNTVLFGVSSENCRLKSTGLTGTALITSVWSLPMRNITIEADVAFNLDATGNSNQALDWYAVNLTNCESCGTIKTYTNFIMQSSAFLDSGDLTFDGSIGTIAFETCLFENRAGKTSIILPATLTVTRRFRIIYSSFVTLGLLGETGINASTSMTIPNEGYILDAINFAGGGTYLAGISTSDNKSRITDCRGINNSANIAQYYMNNNATATTIAVSGTFYKALGTTTTGEFVEKFDVTTTSNKAVYKGSLTGFYKITACLTVTGSSNKEVAIRSAKNGVTSPQSEITSTTSAGGKAEGITCQDIVSLATDDYLEIFITNNTDTSSLTVEDLNVIIERLN